MLEIIGNPITTPKIGRKFVLRHIVTECDMLHVTVCDFLYLSIQYILDASFGTYLTFQMSLLERLANITFS